MPQTPDEEFADVIGAYDTLMHSAKLPLKLARVPFAATERWRAFGTGENEPTTQERITGIREEVARILSQLDENKTVVQ